MNILGKFFGQLVPLGVLVVTSAGATSPNDGDLDLSWGEGGERRIAFDAGGTNKDVAADSVVGPDGAVYIVGTVFDAIQMPHIGITKLLPDGFVDTVNFGNKGKTFSPSGFHATSVALRNNVLYVGGFKDAGGADKDFAVCIYSSTTGLSLSFPGAGGAPCVTASIDLGLSTQVANDIAVQSDGKIVLGGYTRFSLDGNASMFVRFNADGKLDDTFGPLHDGIVWFRNAAYSDEEVRAIGIASNGKIVGVGAGTRVGITGANALLVRITDAGLQDPIPASPFNEASFGFDGDPDLATEFNDLVLVPSAKAPDDDIVAVGSTEITNTATNGMIARIKSSGVLDAGFSGGDSTVGYTLLSFGTGRIVFNAVTRQPGSGFVVAATSTSPLKNPDMRAIRYRENGDFDNVMNTAAIDFADNYDDAVSVTFDRNTVYLVGTTFANDTSRLDYVAAKMTMDRTFAGDFED